MAFKMNYGKGEFPFKKTEEEEQIKIKKGDRPDHKDVQKSMYTEEDSEERFTPEEKLEGAGASEAFLNPANRRRGKKRRYKKEGTDDKYGTFRDGPDVDVKKNIFSGKSKVKLDSIAHRDRIKDLEVKAGIGDYSESPTAHQDMDFAFEGPTTNVNRDITDRKRKAVFNPKTGMVEERYQSKSGIYRPTGRSFYDQAYVDASKKEE